MKSKSRSAEIKLNPSPSISNDALVEPILGASNASCKKRPPQIKNRPYQNKQKAAKSNAPKKAAVVFTSLLLLVSVIVFSVDQLMRPDAFEIEELHITAKFENINPAMVQTKALELINDNYFALDLSVIEQNVRNMPWVDQVSVRRKWPKAIHIKLTEQKPVARWAEQGYLNTRGEMFQLDKQMPQRQSKLDQLPYLEGPEGTQSHLLKTYTQWHKQLVNRDLLLDRLILTPRYAYQIVAKVSAEKQKELIRLALKEIFSAKQQKMPLIDLSSIEPVQVTIKLGKNDANQRLKRLMINFDQVFAGRLLDVDSIDLRYPNGLAVKWREADWPQKLSQFAIKLDTKNKG